MESCRNCDNLSNTIQKVKSMFRYANISEEVLDELVKSANASDFRASLIKLVLSYIKEDIEQRGNYDILLGYINSELKKSIDCEECLESLTKFVSFLDSLELSVSDEAYTYLIYNSDILRSLLETLVNSSTNEFSIKVKDKTINSRINEMILILYSMTAKMDDDHCALTADDERELFIRYRNGDARAYNILVERNIGLVKSIASNYVNRGLSYDDLVQEGSISLIKAMEKFDVNRGYKFSTYATQSIKQGITRAINEQARTIRISEVTISLLNKIDRAINRLTIKLERTPSICEIANEVGINAEETQDLIEIYKRRTVSLNTKIGKDEAIELVEVIPCEDSYDNVYDSFIKNDIRELINDTSLTDRERQAIEIRFGLVDGREHSQEETGYFIGCSRMRVCQLERRAIAKFRLKALRNPKYRGMGAYIGIYEDAESKGILLEKIL